MRPRFDALMDRVEVGGHSFPLDQLTSVTGVVDLSLASAGWSAPERNALDRLLDDLGLVRGADARRDHSSNEIRSRLAVLDPEATR